MPQGVKYKKKIVYKNAKSAMALYLKKHVSRNTIYMESFIHLWRMILDCAATLSRLFVSHCFILSSLTSTHNDISVNYSDHCNALIDRINPTSGLVFLWLLKNKKDIVFIWIQKDLYRAYINTYINTYNMY